MTQAFNRDCLEAMREFPDKFFDLAVVDPPYWDVQENRPTKWMKERISGESNKRILFNYGKPTADYFKELERVSKEQIIFGANNYAIPFKGFIVWDKCVRGSPNYSQAEIASLSEGLATVSTIAQYSTQTAECKIHPTQKPIALYRWIYQTYAKPGDKILDTHLGSGSSRIAAYDAGVDFWGYEIDKTYFDLQEERFAKHTAQQNLFLQEGLWNTTP